MRFNKTVTVAALVLAFTVFGGHNAYATDTKQTLEPGKDSQAHTNTNANTKVDVTVSAGDTLPAIAKAHHTTVEAVMAENSITNANLVEPGQVIKVTPGKEQLIDKYDKLQAAASAFMTPPAPQPAATKVVAQTATTYTTRSYSSAPTSSNSRYVGNGMWCTDYVHSRRPDVAVYGNAGYNWIGSAQRLRQERSRSPMVMLLMSNQSIRMELTSFLKWAGTINKEATTSELLAPVHLVSLSTSNKNTATSAVFLIELRKTPSSCLGGFSSCLAPISRRLGASRRHCDDANKSFVRHHSS